MKYDEPEVENVALPCELFAASWLAVAVACSFCGAVYIVHVSLCLRHREQKFAERKL